MKIDPRNIYPLKGAVQHYAWGGFDYIPSLLGLANDDRKPFAEYWMGIHPLSPSQVKVGDEYKPLARLLDEDSSLLGQEVKAAFGELPFLLKILDVREMLSIQVHPSQEAAQRGFDEEDEKGIERNAPHRNYKDRNHKPEVMLALSDFWLLHGFLPEADLLQQLNATPELRFLAPVFESGGYEALYRHVMEMPQQEVDRVLLPLVQRELRRRSFHETERSEPGYWVGEYYLNKKMEQMDKGIFSIYFFNIVQLKPGEAIFQDAGLPHAYLQGQNVELMANSDNVLRGGLTPKHIDVPELMKHVRFEAVIPKVIASKPDEAEQHLAFPVRDFALDRVSMQPGLTLQHKAAGPEILICTAGTLEVSAANHLTMGKGEAMIAFAGCQYELKGTAPATVYRATAG